MAKINWQDIGQLTAVDQNGINKAIIIPAKEALRQVRFALNGNLTLRDNQYAAVVTLGYSGNSTQTLTSGTEYTFQNPLKTTPIGFTPIKCIKSTGTSMAISDCKLNTSRTDGLIGISLGFGTDGHTGPCLIKTASGNLSVTNNTNTVITGWDTTVKSRGSVISTSDNANFLISESGTYSLNVKLTMESATYTSVHLYLSDTAEQPARLFLPVAFTDGPILSISSIGSYAAGNMVNAIIFQTNATLATRIANVLRRIAIHRLFSEENGIVTGILWGG